MAALWNLECLPSQPPLITSPLPPSTALQGCQIACNFALPVSTCPSTPVPVVYLGWAPPTSSYSRLAGGVDFPSAMASSVAYGVVVYLSAFSLHATLVARRHSAKRKWLLSGYIILMLALSTISLAEELVMLVFILFDGVLPVSFGQFVDAHLSLDMFVLGGAEWATSSSFLSVFPFIVWAADALMMWRCIVLYQGTTSSKQVSLWILLGSLYLASLGPSVLIQRLASADPYKSVWVGGLDILVDRDLPSHQLRKVVVGIWTELDPHLHVDFCLPQRTAFHADSTSTPISSSLHPRHVGHSSWIPVHAHYGHTISPLLMVCRVASGIETKITMCTSEVVTGELGRGIRFRTFVSTSGEQGLTSTASTA
ncbi:LOW QUALITY PROTEIN: hypothetical protein CVT26_007895 [Gymnopilus dilepis]|uniref:Uncharacterized protein n=1 Tax=Gymnopilus dilepis TaxID=231916 RepID=A0A409YK84_9AGAR|nr:LOW QUALITY PROTEIN: hypothetical protein CVT26_007895 [Gymnopilus dilepis]